MKTNSKSRMLIGLETKWNEKEKKEKKIYLNSTNKLEWGRYIERNRKKKFTEA